MTKGILFFNNHLRVAKSHFCLSALSSSRSAALSHRPKGQCSHARSAPPLPKNLGRCPAIFGNPVSAYLRLNSERVNARNFLIGEALKDCAQREKRRLARRRACPLVVSQITEKSFFSFKTFFVNTIISRKSKNHAFCFCTLHRAGGVTEEGEAAAFL